MVRDKLDPKGMFGMHARTERQHGTPLYLRSLDDSSAVEPLRRVSLTDAEYNEDWLQNLLFRSPQLLPIAEIEPVFAPLIPVCKELPTDAGPIDLTFVNGEGLLTLVECKLWRNPEARREVVGQILDYAKELGRWSYEDLEKAVAIRTNVKGNSLYELVNEAMNDVDEKFFVDNISRNLKRGRFLLLIAGDGIREGVENIANFLQAHAGLHFTFGLVELSVFRMPGGEDSGWLIEPRILARTLEIERAVVRVDHEALSVEAPADQDVTHRVLGRRVKITEQEFYESLYEEDPQTAGQLPGFFDRCEEAGLMITKGGASMIIHWVDEDFGKVNFGTVFKDGLLNTNYICASAREAGDVSIGQDYLSALAELIGNATVSRTGNDWTWRVVRHGKMPPVREVLKFPDRWLALIENTIERFMALKKG